MKDPGEFTFELLFEMDNTTRIPCSIVQSGNNEPTEEVEKNLPSPASPPIDILKVTKTIPSPLPPYFLPPHQKSTTNAPLNTTTTAAAKTPWVQKVTDINAEVRKYGKG